MLNAASAVLSLRIALFVKVIEVVGLDQLEPPHAPVKLVKIFIMINYIKVNMMMGLHLTVKTAIINAVLVFNNLPTVLLVKVIEE